MSVTILMCGRERLETGGPGGVLDGQASRNGEATGPVRDLVSRNKVESG